MSYGLAKVVNRSMVEPRSDKHYTGLWERFRKLPKGKKVILVVFLIWLAQALPKWTAAITADGELSARIMKVFVTPR
jgi:hypothetical protein